MRARGGLKTEFLLSFSLVGCWGGGGLQYTVRKEIKTGGDSEILHEIVSETTRISSCFSDFRVVSRTILCGTVSWNPLYSTFHFRFNSVQYIWLSSG